MTETPDAATVPTTDSGSFLGNLFNLYFEPTAAFGKIFARPRLVGAIVLQIVIGFVFTSIWFQKLDAREFMRVQMEQNSRMQQMPAEQVERIIETQANFLKTWGRIGPLLAPLVLDLLVGGILMFVFRFFMAADVTFLQSLTTAAWTYAAVGLVQTPIILAVFFLKGDWNVSPDQLLQANPTMFFELNALPRWLWSLLSSFDLFSFWTAFLLSTGFAVASKRALGSAMWGIGMSWAVYVLGKVAFLFLLG